MRIISGKAKGTKISTIKSMTTRPTLDRVKESLFNIIQYELNNTVVLDLFAGSGALGIEALSRGAKKAVFCDTNLECIKVIKQNLEKTHLTSNAIIYNKDYKECLKELTKNNIKLDIVFIDPPYKKNIAVDATKTIMRLGLLNKNGFIVIETDEINRDENELNELLNKDDNILFIKSKRKYGRANLIFLSVIEEK